jgi:hypothetical protein
MMLLALAVDCCCSRWLSESNPEIYNLTGSNGYAEVRDCYFASMSRMMGGAVYLDGFSDIEMSDCSFHSCIATDPAFVTYGGACDLGSTRLSFTRCCGISCRSDNYGQFLFIIGTRVIGGLSASDHAISEVTALACGAEDCRFGTLYLESPVSASFRDVNVTNCVVAFQGAALYAESGDQRYTASYFHADGCSYADTIVTNCRKDFPTLDHANFYNNAPASNGSVLYGNHSGMSLRDCVFSGNTGTLVYTVGEKFDLDFCYFSNSAPSDSHARLGPGCVSNSEAASYGVFAINTHDCPGIPRATASPVQTPSAVLLQSATVYSIGALRTFTFSLSVMFSGTLIRSPVTELLSVSRVAAATLSVCSGPGPQTILLLSKSPPNSDAFISAILPGTLFTLPATELFSASRVVAATLRVYSEPALQTLPMHGTVALESTVDHASSLIKETRNGRSLLQPSRLLSASTSHVSWASAAFLNSQRLFASSTAGPATADSSNGSAGSSLGLSLTIGIASASFLVLLAIVAVAIFLYRAAVCRAETSSDEVECAGFGVANAYDTHVFSNPLELVGTNSSIITDCWQDVDPDEVFTGV